MFSFTRVPLGGQGKRERKGRQRCHVATPLQWLEVNCFAQGHMLVVRGRTLQQSTESPGDLEDERFLNSW